MYLYTEGKLVASAVNKFDDEKGEPVVFFENIIKTDDGMLTINSKDSYESHEGKYGVCKIGVRENQKGPGHKLTLQGFTEGEVLDTAEETLD